MEANHGPFETIEMWKFLFALLELSWELYSRLENTESLRGRLASGFCKLMELDIYPNAGKRYGIHIFNLLK